MGWEGGRTRTAVQRLGGAFFSDVGVARDTRAIDASALQADLDNLISHSLRDTAAERRRRLTLAAKLPRKVMVTSAAFLRNPDVVAETLLRAGGSCERRGSPAPFLRKKDGSPYLEVHHRRRLAHGGEDTVENAVALCPNCHRREHYA